MSGRLLYGTLYAVAGPSSDIPMTAVTKKGGDSWLVIDRAAVDSEEHASDDAEVAT